MTRERRVSLFSLFSLFLALGGKGSVRWNNNSRRLASRAQKAGFAVVRDPGDKFQGNLAALAFLLVPPTPSVLVPPLPPGAACLRGVEKLKERKDESRARTCLEKFRENVRGNPLSRITSLRSFLPPTWRLSLVFRVFHRASSYDNGGGQHGDALLTECNYNMAEFFCNCVLKSDVFLPFRAHSLMNKLNATAILPISVLTELSIKFSLNIPATKDYIITLAHVL